MLAAVHEAFIAIEPLDLPATMAQQMLGRFDPTARRSARRFQKVHHDAHGEPLVWRFDTTDAGLRVRVAGPGAEAALRDFTAQFPLADGAETFRAQDPVLARLCITCAGLRLLRMPWAFDVAAGIVLQQRVRWQVAYTDFRRVAERFGARINGGVAFPSARTLARVAPARLEAMGIDGKRARALIALARLEAERRVLAVRDTVLLRNRLQLLPGIGPWTTNMIAGYAAGDPDAVPVGDLHLPSIVTAALADEPEGTDERMLELLEPYRGQRFRVVRLLSWGERRALSLSKTMRSA